MAYDALSEKTDQYQKDRKNLDEEFVLFSEEEERLKGIGTSALDGEVQEAFAGVRADFRAAEAALEKRNADLEDVKKELAGAIGGELETLGAAREKLDRLSGERYAAGLGNAVEKCDAYIRELEEMLDVLELPPAFPGGGQGGGHAGLDAANSDHGRGVKKPPGADPAAHPMAGYPRISGPHTMLEDLRATNPNFSYTDPDPMWNYNCQRCVSAYEARRRGYDVEARPSPGGRDTLSLMHHPEGWPSVYKNAQLIDCSASTGALAAVNVSDQMRRWGNGARAIVRIRWNKTVDVGGHVFIAEMANGRVAFIDPQSGESDASAHFSLTSGADLYCMRIDNLEFSDRIQLCCKSREGGRG